MKTKTFYDLLALCVIALTVIPVGIAVFILGFMRGDSPCMFCWEQRIGMTIIALIGLFILRYGPQRKYLGSLVLVGAFGVYMALRHWSMHATWDIGQGFSIEILGAHTYVWSLAVFWLCLFAAGIALLVVKDSYFSDPIRPLAPLGKAAMITFLVVATANAFQAVTSTGPPPFLGQRYPVRYSFNPVHWVWSLEDWSSGPVSLRGRRDVSKPGLNRLDTETSHGPLNRLKPLSIKRNETLDADLNGEATDIAYDEVTAAFLLTTAEGGIYLLDSGLKKVSRYTVIDASYKFDLDHLVGAAFTDSQTVTAMAWNKSFVTLRLNDRADARKNFRYFRESAGCFDEILRSHFSTSRARMQYVMALGYAPDEKSFYTVTVPNRRYKRLIISRFDQAEIAAAEEYSPQLSAASGLTFSGSGRTLNEYYVTGIAIKNRLMYAISAAYHTLLVINLDKREVVAAYAVPGLSKPCGLAVKGDELYFLSKDNIISVADRPLIR